MTKCSFDRVWSYDSGRINTLVPELFLPAKYIAHKIAHTITANIKEKRKSSKAHLIHFPKTRCSQPRFKLTILLLLPLWPSDCCHPVPLSHWKKQILAVCHKQGHRKLRATHHNQYNNTILTRPWWSVETAARMTLMASAVMNNSLVPHQSRQAFTTGLLQTTAAVDSRI